MREEKITLCCCTEPRLDNLKHLLPAHLPFIDRAVIILGRRDKKTEDYLDSLGEKVEWYYHQWEDDFAKQWNNFLQYVNEGDWLLVLDDDEYLSDLALSKLNSIVEKSNQGKNFCCVAFQCQNISEGQIAEKPAEYWRQLFYRFVPGLHYRGGPKTGCHQYVVGYQNNRIIRTDLIYHHSKSLKEEYKNAARNYFIYGIWLHGASDGIQREEWHELKSLVNKYYPEVNTFQDLDDIFLAGKINPGLTDWMYYNYDKYRDHPEYNEMRAFCVYYLKYLHPEEKISAFEL